MSSSRLNAQLNLPPSLLTNDSPATARRTSRSADLTAADASSTQRTNHSDASTIRTNCSTEPEALSAQLFDEALREAKHPITGRPEPVTSQEAAALCGVSESLVNRWRSANYRETPSFTQMLRLPPAFHLAMNRVISRRFGFGRAALVRVLESMGDLALAGDL